MLIQAIGIHKSFGPVEVLHGVDLHVEAGEILALLGENGAGKSTLVRTLAGDHVPDSGQVRVGGQDVTDALTPRGIRQRGLFLISQENSSVADLTVAENVALGAWPSVRGWVSWRSMRRRARAVLAELGLSIDVNRLVSSLGVGERQLVDIARALVADARCLILDEPTAALSQVEADQLFRMLRRLREKGAGIIYITHRLPEVQALADRVQVLRDGRTVLVGPVGELDKDDIVTAMVGEAVHHEDPAQRAPLSSGTAPLIELRSASAPGFQDLDLAGYPGEILVLYGKVGAGAAEAAASLFGLHALHAGSIHLRGKPIRLRGPHEAIAHGIGYLPGERRSCGFAEMSLASNLCAPSWRRLSARGVITSRRESDTYSRWYDTLSVRGGARAGQPLASLSGGNQQKVLLGRWLEMNAAVLVLVEPTRGVDIKARQEIYRLVREVAANGSSVIVATSDQEEAAILADRAMVLSAGRMVSTLTRPSITEDRLLTTAIRGEHSPERV